MIVSDNNVTDALHYLALDPHPVALSRKDVTDAENRCKQAFAKAFLSAEGSVEARKAIAEVSDEHVAAKSDESDAIMEFERHKARAKAADMLISVWQSENANERAAGKVR